MLVQQTEDWQLQVNECEQLVVTYQSLARQIAYLLMAHGGVTQNMSDEDFASYRQLAMRRDLVCHMIHVMEHNLLID